ncbi:hypothetical protein O6P43_008588 [Quillaja saponaria]|uniref:Uncharacterized protein n=1 Tax=Quillaja saponaria TaxID=32244 RepID=A0AAD7PWR3_QUISA|nr:hypothetical protein O6P43_008588 [Quillaja saponaria]
MDSKAEEINESDGERSYWWCLLMGDLYYVLEDDDKNNFLDIMNNLSYKPEVFPFTVISGIIIACAHNITTAVLNGETGQKVDVKAVCPRTGESLLHQAAFSSDLSTVDTLLRLRARTDVRCNKGKLPLNERTGIEIVTLLFWNTDETEFEVFERVGDKIMAYYIHHSADDVCADMKGIKVTTDLAWLIQEAGFIIDYADLHIKDRLHSKWEKVWQSLRDQVNSEIEQEKSLYLRFPNSMDSIDLQLCGKKEKGKKKLWNVTVKHDGKMLKAKKSITCNELDDNLSLVIPYWGRYLTKAHTSREFATNTRAKAKSFPVTKALVEPNFLLFKQYASVTLPILRRIRLL